MATSAANLSGTVEHSELSDIGLRRANNQDSLAVAMAGDADDWVRRGHLFMVADGMGAHAAGEKASELAIKNVPHTYRKLLDRPPHQALRQAIVDANAQIHQRGQDDAEFHGMGTTASVLVLLPQGAIVAHVGDSRVYRLRSRRFEQLTFDHSLVWEMMAAGQIPRGEVPSFVPKNIITRSLGPHPDVQVDLEGPFPLQPGDTFLLCSDGLSGQVSDAEMGTLLDVLSPQEAVRTLVDLANLRGGPDNITVIVARVTQPVEPKSAPLAIAGDGQPSQSRLGLQTAAWVAMGVLALAGAGLAAAGLTTPAMVSAAGAVAAVVAGLLLGLSKPAESDQGYVEAPLGAGPHHVVDCDPNREIVAELARTAEQVCEAAADKQLQVHFDAFEAHRQSAVAAVAGKDQRSAVREYALAISALMEQIRSSQTADGRAS